MLTGSRLDLVMDTIPALIMIFGAAFAWIVLTVFALRRLRRRRKGSSQLTSAAPRGDPNSAQRLKPWHRIRPAKGPTSARRRKFSVRKVRS